MTNNLPPQGPAGGYGEQEPGLNSGSPFPQYPSSDQPQGGPSYSYDAPGVALVTGTGKLSVLASIGKSFSLFGKSVGPWLGFGLVAGVVTMITAIIVSILLAVTGMANPRTAEITLPGQIIQSILISIVVGVFTVYGINGALQSIEGRELRFKSFFRLKHSIVNPLIVVFIVLFASQIPSMSTQALSFNLNNASADPTAAVTAGVLGSLAVSAVSILVVVLVAPLFLLSMVYVVDENISVGEAFSRCLSGSLPNYLPLLGASVLMGLIGLISMIPAGLGLLVTIPMSYMMQALLYRQQTGGQHVALD